MFGSKLLKENAFPIRNWGYRLIKNTWLKYIHNAWNYMKNGIVNLFKWRKVIWKDRDWDYHFILDVLKFKIKNTRDYILKCNRIGDEDQDRIKRYTTIAIKLIDAIREETYGTEYLDYFESKFNFIPTGKTVYNNLTCKHEDTFEMEVIEISSAPKPYTEKYKRVYKRVKHKIEKEQPDRIDDIKYIALKIAQENHCRAKSLLFKILNDEISFWWD